MRLLLPFFLLVACDGGTDTDPDTDTDGATWDGRAVLINELLAVNDTINTDEAGENDDWFELYNPHDAEVDLTGWTITDDVGSKIPAPLPSGAVLAPGQHLLLWADDDTEQGILHLPFKLSGDGETLTLLAPDGSVADEVDFPAQTADISWGRSPDGSDDWTEMTPTPEGANE